MTSTDIPINSRVTVTGGVLKDIYKGRALIEFPDRTESWVPLNRVFQGYDDEPALDAVVEVNPTQGGRRYFRRSGRPGGSTPWWEIGTACWLSWRELRSLGPWCELERRTLSGDYTDKL